MGHFLTRAPAEVAMLSSTKPLYRVLRSIEWQPNDGKGSIKVRAGFVSDGTSLPKIFRSLVTIHKVQKAAFLHDWLYTHREYHTRKWAE